MSSMLYTSKQFFAMFHGSGPDLWSIYPTNEPGAFSPFESQTSPLSDAPSTFTSASLGFLPISAAASLDYTCASPSNHGVSQDNTPFHPFMGYAPSLPTDTGIQGFSASSLPDVDDYSFGPEFFGELWQSSPHLSHHALLSPPPYHTEDYQPAMNSPHLFNRNSESPYLAHNISPPPDTVHAPPSLLTPPLLLPSPPLLTRTLVSPYNVFVDVDGVKKNQCMLCPKRKYFFGPVSIRKSSIDCCTQVSRGVYPISETIFGSMILTAFSPVIGLDATTSLSLGNAP